MIKARSFGTVYTSKFIKIIKGGNTFIRDGIKDRLL